MRRVLGTLQVLNRRDAMLCAFALKYARPALPRDLRRLMQRFVMDEKCVADALMPKIMRAARHGNPALTMAAYESMLSHCKTVILMRNSTGMGELIALAIACAMCGKSATVVLPDTTFVFPIASVVQHLEVAATNTNNRIVFENGGVIQTYVYPAIDYLAPKSDCLLVSDTHLFRTQPWFTEHPHVVAFGMAERIADVNLLNSLLCDQSVKLIKY